MDLRTVVEEKLREGGASEQAVDLWTEIMDAFEDGGPTAVRKAVEARVSEATTIETRSELGEAQPGT